MSFFQRCAGDSEIRREAESKTPQDLALNVLLTVPAKERRLEKWLLLGEMCKLVAHLKWSQNYYMTVFSGLFSEFFVKRDTIQSNIQFQY